MLLQVQHLKKVYKTRFSLQSTEALKDVNFSVEAGEFIAIMGESGSGKSTLLNLLALLDTPTAGTILLKDKDLARIPEKEMAKFRRENLGFVFQDFHLLDTFTVKENILLPLVLREEAPRQMEEKLAPLARRLGIADLLDKYPYEISGGQQQRAAICRALVTEPEILLADEPTGALDSHASRELLETFEEIHAAGQTILMVTHSVKAASRAKRVLFIRDGVIFHQLYKGNATNFEAEERIAATMQMLGRGSRDV